MPRVNKTNPLRMRSGRLWQAVAGVLFTGLACGALAQNQPAAPPAAGPGADTAQTQPTAETADNTADQEADPDAQPTPPGNADGESQPPDSEPEPAPEPEPALTVRDLVVLQTDRYGEVANAPTQVKTSLFVPINHTRRSKHNAPDGSSSPPPMPLGLISFEGRIDKPMRVRLDLRDERGFFHAHWPNDAVKGERIIDWFQVAQAGQRQAPAPMDLGGHWLATMREMDDRLWLRTRDPVHKERFLLYDASLPFEPQLEVGAADTGYRLVNTRPENTPPLALLLSRKEAGWRVASTTAPWSESDETRLALEPIKPRDQTGTIAADSPLLPLARWLTERGYNRQETLTALRMVANAGLNKSSMSLVYLLPEGEIDRHIQLRFRPEPDRLIRTAIVVVNNVDPDLGSRLDRLVAGLGDERWVVRQRSQQQLEAIGLAAIRKLQAASESEDPEIAFRARQLLDAYDLRQEATR